MVNGDRSTLHVLASHLAGAVEPLRRWVVDRDSFRTLMFRLGWEVDSLPPPYAALADAAAAISTSVETLADDADLDTVLALIGQVGDVHRAIKGIQAAPVGVDAGAFLAEVQDTLFEALLIEYLIAVAPGGLSGLEALGIVVHEDHPAVPGRPAFVHTRLRLERIPEILTHPQDIPALIYAAGGAEFAFDLLAEHLVGWFNGLGFLASFRRPDPDLAAGFQAAATAPARRIDREVRVSFFDMTFLGERVEVGFSILELPAEGTRLPGIIVQPFAPPEFRGTIPLNPEVKLTLRAGTDLAAQFGVVLRPDEIDVRYPFQPGATLPAGGFGLSLVYAPAAPLFLLGAPEKTRLQLAGASATFDLDFTNEKLELRLGATVDQLTLVVAAGDLDGFLSKILGGTDLRVPIPCRVEWSSRSGLSFTVGAGFAVSLYPHLALGPVVVDRFDLGVVTTVGGPPDLNVEAAVTLSGALGPVAFAVDAIGLRLRCLFQDGNAGPFDIGLGFKPPAGLGIAIDAGPITGGGFIAFDPANGRYAGILQLQLYTVAVTAIGLLDTRLPGGASGFSFLIVIAVELPPIQLGFGFALTDVGGLAGLNRTMVVDAFRAALQTGSLDHVMFPEDPIRNAPQILSDLRTFFPPAEGRYIFGPMFKLTWGAPILLRAEIGLILELPDPIRLVMLGRLAIALPTEDERIVDLHIDFVGVVDFGARLLAIDATLHDSRVVAWPISGDMAARVSWGADKNLAVALGGLNPHFTPPPGFPDLRRLTIAFGLGDNPRITMQAYLALTSNTRQIGARAEVYAAAAGFNIYGWVSFDALLTILPLAFTADLSAGVALRRGTRTIAGVHLSATLTGPLPMRARGKACLSLFFFDICVPFDVTVGEAIAEALSTIDPWPLLQAAIKDVRNWSTALLPGVAAVASVGAPKGSAPGMLVEPMGSLTLRQTVVPLNRTIERFGDLSLQAPMAYTVQSIAVGGDPVATWVGAQDHFAPAQFHALSDAEKLSRPSFELMDAGVTLGSAALELGTVMGADLVYETIVIDDPWDGRRPAPPYRVALTHQLASLQLGAAARSELRAAGLEKFAPPPGKPALVDLADDRFVVVSAEDLSARIDISGPSAKGAALDALRRYEVAHPEDLGHFQVIALHELEVA
jgi:hypothetical protein